jgi:hypothetical protein
MTVSVCKKECGGLHRRASGGFLQDTQSQSMAQVTPLANTPLLGTQQTVQNLTATVLHLSWYSLQPRGLLLRPAAFLLLRTLPHSIYMAYVVSALLARGPLQQAIFPTQHELDHAGSSCSCNDIMSEHLTLHWGRGTCHIRCKTVTYV